MKKLLLIGWVLLLLSCKSINSDTNIEIDNNYFSLGASTDYGGQHLFETDLQKISFVTGVYTEYSYKEVAKDSVLTIKLIDSDSKARMFTRLLKELECTNIEHIYYNDNAPSVSIVHFTPTDDLKKYFDRFINLK